MQRLLPLLGARKILILPDSVVSPDRPAINRRASKQRPIIGPDIIGLKQATNPIDGAPSNSAAIHRRADVVRKQCCQPKPQNPIGPGKTVVVKKMLNSFDPGV